MQTSKIRPGLLVALKTSVTGGVHYHRTDLETNETMAKWETTRVIDDPAEHDKATKARGSAIAEIRKVCAATSFGLICPLDRESDLEVAVNRARDIVDQYNNSSNYSHVEIFVLKGIIATSDQEAANAIASEVSQLMASMQAGIDKLDAGAIRESALKAKQIATLLDIESQTQVSAAITQARLAARTIVKRIEKSGEDAAFVLSQIQRSDIERARVAFLEIDDTTPESVTLPEVSQRAADLDLSDDTSEDVSSDTPETNAPNTEIMKAVSFSDDMGEM